MQHKVRQPKYPRALNHRNLLGFLQSAALSQPNFCQNYPEESHAINVIASCNIAGLCADYSIPCAFTSTDLVFDGLNAPYRETDTVCPVNIYGEQKVQAESGMLERYPMTAICRMPLMFGMATPTATSFIQPFIQTIKEGKDLNLFIDEFRTPVSGLTACNSSCLKMPRITLISWQRLEKVFLAAGFEFARQEGSHRCYIKPSISRPVVIPTYDEIPVSIIRNHRA